MAVAYKAGGLFHDSFDGAMLHDEIAYHGFEGITEHAEEIGLLASSLGACNLMILKNHGLLACGADIPTSKADFAGLAEA